MPPRGASVDVGPPSVERILIVRLSAMGDIIHSLPAVTALRNALPDAMIGWVIEERWAELLSTPTGWRAGARSAQRPLVDRIHVVNTKQWRDSFLSPRTARQIAGMARELREVRYQATVDLQGAVRSAITARLSQASLIYGAARPRESLAKYFYTHRVSVHGEHIAEQNLSIVEPLAGQSLAVPQVELPVDHAAGEYWDRFLGENNVSRFVVLNPGAGWGAKQWPADRYGRAAQELAAVGFRSLINYGPGEEEIAKSVASASNGAALPVSSSITQLIALTRRASLFIGGDTGPAHLAAALRVPVVGIFGPTNPARNGPFGTDNIVLRSPLSATDHSRRTQPEEGLLQITVEEVVAAARQLLGRSHG